MLSSSRENIYGTSLDLFQRKSAKANTHTRTHTNKQMKHKHGRRQNRKEKYLLHI